MLERKRLSRTICRQIQLTLFHQLTNSDLCLPERCVWTYCHLHFLNNISMSLKPIACADTLQLQPSRAGDIAKFFESTVEILQVTSLFGFPYGACVPIPKVALSIGIAQQLDGRRTQEPSQRINTSRVIQAIR